MRTARGALALVAALAVATGPGAGAAGARPGEVPVHPVAIVDPNGDRLVEGDGATPFALALPDGASCPGDSAEAGYRVNSYMVPTAVAPEDVTYDGLGPTPSSFGEDHASFRQPLFALDTNFFVSAQTADAEQPGDPGLIVGVPAFSFAVFEPGDVPPGEYRIGLACTLLNEVEVVWDAQLTVTEDAAAPAGLRWGALGVEDDGGGTGPGTLVVVAAVVAAALIAYAARRTLWRAPVKEAT